MGGQICADCTTCISTEFSFARAYPSTVDAKFAKHWDTWFTQDDVDQLKAAGINTVRIPLGYWIVEALVDRQTEFYPRGGLAFLRRGLKMLHEAGIQAILDHHALPGVQTPGQMFTGDCTNNVQFYTPHNYHRALVWTAVMTALSHLDPAFINVFSIEAVNEPISDASRTPGYGDFQKNFVQTVRAVEDILGIPGSAGIPSALPNILTSASNFTAALSDGNFCSRFSSEVQAVLREAAPILLDIGGLFGLLPTLTALPFQGLPNREALTTK
ncbi:glycoside hydrolase [Leucogyrophana mollusca]|uniref:Glycoside hydrolase n=1 Tax=Leucogyrophana mollusca TaxID=85980 RepID=A0ACB8AYR8_9AGAM|nr:glycoside hydrolase [Leucogyrophana mollusca]